MFRGPQKLFTSTRDGHSAIMPLFLSTSFQGWVSDDVCYMPYAKGPFFFFHDGITFEHFKLEGWNFVWGLIREIFSKNEPMEKFRPPYLPLKQME